MLDVCSAINMTKGILYYTDNKLDEKIAGLCRVTITQSGLPITSVSLSPLEFGKNITLDLKPSHESMFTQIVAGLKSMSEDVVYFAEHDVLYHPGHWKFTPKEDKFYYNGNYWVLRIKDGVAVHYNMQPLSGFVAYRESALIHFEERLEKVKKEGFSYKMGFEPMTHKRIDWKNWYDFERFYPEYPNIDLAHGNNSTKKKWSFKDFRKKPTFWFESEDYRIPGWPYLRRDFD